MRTLTLTPTTEDHHNLLHQTPSNYENDPWKIWLLETVRPTRKKRTHLKSIVLMKNMEVQSERNLNDQTGRIQMAPAKDEDEIDSKPKRLHIESCQICRKVEQQEGEGMFVIQ